MVADVVTLIEGGGVKQNADWSRACVLLQLKLSFYHQRDLQVRANDDRHWDFMMAPGGPQAAAAAAEYHQAAHSAAAASRGDAGGNSGQHSTAAGSAVPSSPRSPRSKQQHDPNAPITGRACASHQIQLCQLLMSLPCNKSLAS